MKLKIHFSNGKTGDESGGFDMKIEGSKEKCLAVLEQSRQAIEELAKGEGS